MNELNNLVITDLTELEFVKDGSLTGGIETDHQDTHFLLLARKK